MIGSDVAQRALRNSEELLAQLRAAATPFSRDLSADPRDEFAAVHMVVTKGELDALNRALEAISPAD